MPDSQLCPLQPLSVENFDDNVNFLAEKALNSDNFLHCLFCKNQEVT